MTQDSRAALTPMQAVRILQVIHDEAVDDPDDSVRDRLVTELMRESLRMAMAALRPTDGGRDG